MAKATVLGEVVNGEFIPQDKLELCECERVLHEERIHIAGSKVETVKRVVIDRESGSVKFQVFTGHSLYEVEMKDARCPKCGNLLRKPDEKQKSEESAVSLSACYESLNGTQPEENPITTDSE